MTGTGGNVFENVELREITDEEIDNFDYIPVSSTYLRKSIYSENAKEYIDERVYKYIKEKRIY